MLHELPVRGLMAYREEDVTVKRWGVIRVSGKVYSLPLRLIARLLGDSKLARDKTMATLDTGRFPAPVRTQVARLADGQFLEGATNLCVFGNPGTGKTRVVSALGHELVRQGHSGLFTPVSALVERDSSKRSAIFA